MKTFFSTTVVLISMLCSSANASENCPDTTTTNRLIMNLEQKTDILKRTVINNASVDCIEKMSEFTNRNRLLAAETCKGGVDFTCVDKLKTTQI